MYKKPFRRPKKSVFLPLVITSAMVSLIAMFFGIYLGVLMSEWKVVNFSLNLMPQNRIEDSKNILILGADSNEGTSRSDTIMVVNLNKSRGHIGILSIPRDTYVDLGGRYGKTKINHAYAYGGVEMSKAAVEKLLNIPIDYYLALNMDGVRNMINQIGGIDLDIKKRMYYVDHAGNLYIDFKPGYQHLDGKLAMNYLRYRHDIGSDIGRIGRQQDFIKAVARKMLAPMQVIRLPQIIHDLSGYVKTNMNTGQMFVLALELRDAFKEEHIQVNTIPGKNLELGGVDYWQVTADDVANLVFGTLQGLSTENVELTKLNEQEMVETSARYGVERAKHMDELRRKIDQQKVARAKVEEQKAAQDQLARELEEKLNAEKLAKEQAQKEMIAKQEAIRVAREKVEKERQDRTQAIAAQKAKALADRIAQEKASADRAVQAQQNAKRLADAKLAVDQQAKASAKALAEQQAKVIAERQAQQKMEAERTAKLEAERQAQLKVSQLKEKAKVESLAKATAEQVRLAKAKPVVVKGPEAPAAESSAPTPVADSGPINIEVLNGNGTEGIASRVADQLRSRGLNVPRTGEAAHHNYQNTVIVDWKGNSVAALKLAKAMHVSPTNIITYTLPKKTLDITVVVGKDWAKLGN